MKNISFNEDKWLPLLFNYSKEKFTLKPLPSHDHLHHARVWNYAKHILAALAEAGYHYSLQEVEDILIAVFFHDLGMTITREKSHGQESRKICQQFFDSNSSLLPGNLESVLKMIENHDDKEYANLNSIEGRLSTSAILNISDDLDAFGNIGIYRYTEIYHFRGIKIDELPFRILPNLEARFQHFKKQLGHLKLLVNQHRRRFEITRDFFVSLQAELQSQENLQGPFDRIVQIVIDFSNSGQSNIDDLVSHIRDKDSIVEKFLSDLLIELNTNESN